MCTEALEAYSNGISTHVKLGRTERDAELVVTARTCAVPGFGGARGTCKAPAARLTEIDFSASIPHQDLHLPQLSTHPVAAPRIEFT